MRWDIINHLIKENGYKTYLEIGYYKGWSFDRVECEQKLAIDPNPCKYESQKKEWEDKWKNWAIDLLGAREVIYPYTSDHYFDYLESHNIADKTKIDIIFIDGLHESQQVDKDIQNALKHLSPGGTIVMHDCNPSTYEMTTTGTASGEWTGDVYKSFIKARALYTLNAYTVDTDYGVGIVKIMPLQDKFISVPFGSIPDWGMFDKNRAELLNLVSPEGFLKRETNVKTTTDTQLPA